MPKEQFNINIDELVDVALLGVRRSAVFLGLGLNAASKEDFIDYELRKLPKIEGQTSFPIDFLPPNLSREHIEDFKKNFALWITACGFRELLEHYAAFLDHVHETCLIVACNNVKISYLEAQKAHKKFVRNLGIPDKLDKLEELFNIKPSNALSIKQLYSVRNALTHDLGLVVQQRCGSENYLDVSWVGFETLAKGENTGLEVNVCDLFGRKTEEPMEILMKFPLRQKTFPVGSVITFSQQDLWEICFFFSFRVIPSTKKAFVDYLVDQGVPIQQC